VVHVSAKIEVDYKNECDIQIEPDNDCKEFGRDGNE